MIGEYNSQRVGIILKEYGRNVQNLIQYIRNQPSKEKRTELAYTLIELIKQLTPTIAEQPENPQRLWDDLYIMADFDLDVNNPYPVPDRDILFKKPQRMEYPKNDLKYRHYGKNVEKLVKEALKIEDPQEREDAIIYLGKLMKTFYGNWNKEILDDSVILRDINVMSGGALNLYAKKLVSSVKKTQSQPVNKPSGYKAPADFAPSDTSSLKEGMTVEHPKFGFGMVLQMDNSGTDRKAKINFSDVGEKTLLLSFAKIRIVEN